MNLSRWVDRIYRESDIGRGIATSVAGAAGLATYLRWADWVIAFFVAIIVFPIARILASTFHSHWRLSRKRTYSRDQVKKFFEKLGSEERTVVEAFVYHGGSVVTWDECNRSQHFSAAGIESLISRGLIHVTVTADGMTEAFALDTKLFDYAQTVVTDIPF